MKKVLSIVLILAVVLTSVFALDFHGSATLKLGADFDKKEYGFANNGSLAKIEITADAITLYSENPEVKGDGDIYAGIKASLNVSADGKKVVLLPEIKDNDGFTSAFTYEKEYSKPDNEGYKVVAKIEEAYIAGADWKLNILNSEAGSNYATSAIDTYQDANGQNKPVEGIKPAATAYPGFVFTMKDYKASLGFWGNANGAVFNALFETPEYDISGIVAKAAIVAGTEIDKTLKVGGSVKTGYKADEFTATAAADLYVVKADQADAKFDADVAANFTGFGLGVDFYYGTQTEIGKSLLSARAAYEVKIGDDVTGKVTITGKDFNYTQDVSAKLTAGYKNIEGSVYGGYKFGPKTFTAGGDVKYTADLFVVDAKLDAEKDSLKIEAGISSDKLVSGAELAARYVSGNLFDKKAGSISATATIKF